jgi:hypothetical protein
MIARNKGDEEGCMITRRLMICTTLYDRRYRLHSIASVEITCMTNTYIKRNMVSRMYNSTTSKNLHLKPNHNTLHKPHKASQVKSSGIVKDQVQLGVMWKSDSFESP